MNVNPSLRHFITLSLPLLLGALAAAGATVTLLAWLAGRILSDRYGWSQWLLWIPTPAALAAVICGLLAAIRPEGMPGLRRRRLALWAAVGLAVGFYFGIIEHRLLTRTASAEGLRIVHWTCDREELPDDLLLAVDCDVAILTNAPHARRHEGFLESLSPDRQNITIFPFTLFSRLPILEARPLISTNELHVALFELDAAGVLGVPIRLFAIDLPSDPGRPRMEMARRLRRLLDEAAGPRPDIAIGDFNLTRGSAALKLIFPSLEHAYEQSGAGYAASYPRRMPLYHLDHSLLGERLRATGYMLLDPKLGRHRVQVVDVVKK